MTHTPAGLARGGFPEHHAVKLIVGLGNPGLRYERTRHNAGFMAIDRLVERHASGERPRGRFDGAIIEGRIPARRAPGFGASPAPEAEPVRCAFLKPGTYMNLSGRSVVQAVQFYKVDPATDLMVLADDVALPLGRLRVRAGGGAGGHNGLADIARALGTEAYPRCRIGIDASPAFMDQADWVLSRFDDHDMAVLGPALDRAADAVAVFTHQGIDAAMNLANADPSAPPRPRKPREAEPNPRGAAGAPPGADPPAGAPSP